jgi:hypothetical protein
MEGIKMRNQGQKLKFAVILLLLLALVCGMGGDGSPWMSWCSRLAVSVLIIVPGLAILFRNPHIAQLWFSNPGGIRKKRLGNSTWEDLPILEKILVYVSAIVGVIFGGILLYGTVSEIFSYFGLGY